jgi:hypothetical protein
MDADNKAVASTLTASNRMPTRLPRVSGRRTRSAMTSTASQRGWDRLLAATAQCAAAPSHQQPWRPRQHIRSIQSVQSADGGRHPSQAIARRPASMPCARRDRHRPQSIVGSITPPSVSQAAIALDLEEGRGAPQLEGPTFHDKVGRGMPSASIHSLRLGCYRFGRWVAVAICVHAPRWGEWGNARYQRR